MARILIIDDEPLVRGVLEQAFRRAGHDVACAADGFEGLAAAGDFDPDVAVVDLIMPEKEGLETIRELRQSHPDVLILAVSGGGRIDPASYLPLAENIGANHSLAKPFTGSQVLELIENLLRPAKVG